MFKGEKRGQVSIFVVIALIIVAGIGSYFIVKNNIESNVETGEFSDVFNYYSGCIEQYTKTGLSVAGMQGGWIDIEAYQPGSEYAPFGNQLAVGSVPVTYWYTIEGNGISKERVPTQSVVEKQLEDYISSRLEGCSFDQFRERGLEIEVFEAVVETQLASDGVLVNVNSFVSVSDGNTSSSKQDFTLTVDSNFGNLLEQAKVIYENQQKDLFLENYSYDVLRLYAPVDGVEIQCAPKTWKIQDIFTDLQQGLSENLGLLKFSGNYYENSDNPIDKYYELNIPVEKVDSVQVMYDQSWPSRFEVYGNQGALLVANPMGADAGLSALGFCYVPYHFVYDMMFPVLFRLTQGEDIFQFPVVSVIDKNVPRKAIQSSFGADYGDESDLCESSTQKINIAVRDSDGAVENAKVSYSCFDQSCLVGETDENGNAEGIVPTCINGFLNIQSDKHSKTSELFSSHNSSSALVYVSKEYLVDLNILVDGKYSSEPAFISFVGDNGVKQAVIPDSSTVSLSTGFYNLTIYQYGNVSIRVPASTSNQCVQVSAGGIRGLLGATEEKCFEISIPETIIDKSLTAGGQGEIYLPEEVLQKGNLTLVVQSLPKPTGLESLETSYALFETQGVDVLYE